MAEKPFGKGILPKESNRGRRSANIAEIRVGECTDPVGFGNSKADFSPFQRHGRAALGAPLFPWLKTRFVVAEERNSHGKTVAIRQALVTRPC